MMFILVVYVCAVNQPQPLDCRWGVITPRPVETRAQCEELAKKAATNPFIVKAECRDPSDAP
jgi:hypothetical protein